MLTKSNSVGVEVIGVVTAARGGQSQLFYEIREIGGGGSRTVDIDWQDPNPFANTLLNEL